MAPKANRDPFVEYVSKLRAHILNCYECRIGFNHLVPESVCTIGVLLSMRVAKECDKLFKLKRQAVSTINDYVYACPDIALHGEAFALTAQPLSVVATQDELF